MLRVLASACVLLLGACGEGPSDEQRVNAAEDVAIAESGGRPEPTTGFEAMDANRDGVLTAAEHTAAAGAMFAAMDTDNNQAVTAAEMEKAADGLAATRNLSGAENIKANDLNNDTILSSAEHIASQAADFVKIDTDRNGSVDAAEFNAWQATVLGR